MEGEPDTILCDITGVSSDGEGIARHEGKVVFVMGALPGETVRAEILRRGERSDRARVVEVVTGAGRATTPCAHDHEAGCGGCTLLHGTRAAGAALKHTIVRDALARIAAVDPAKVRPTMTPGPDLHYRNHAKFGVDGKGRLTYFRRTDHRATHDRKSIAIDTCVVLRPELDALRASLSGRVHGVEDVELRVGARTGEAQVILHGVKSVPAGLDVTTIAASVAVAWRDRVIPAKGLGWIHEKVGGRTWRVSARSFFQVNTDGAECLLELVKAFAATVPNSRVLDLYAGVGLFALGSVDPAAEVTAAEIEPFAAADFKVNAVDLPKAHVRALDVVEFLSDFRPGRDHFDVAIVNPPRGGVGDAVVARLAALDIPRLVMVSCDPGSLARDLKTLIAAGYALVEAVPVDQFPGTPHVETVALVCKADPSASR